MNTEDIEAIKAERDNLRRVLEDLYAVQNGAPLIKYEADWQKAMNEAAELLGYTRS